MPQQILNSTKKVILATRAERAETFRSRMIGLLNRESLKDGEALVITYCQSVHMLFMKFPIDVIFVDGADKVVGLVPEIRPFRLSPIFWKSSYAVELPAGTIDKTRTDIGDLLTFSEKP